MTRVVDACLKCTNGMSRVRLAGLPLRICAHLSLTVERSSNILFNDSESCYMSQHSDSDIRCTSRTIGRRMSCLFNRLFGSNRERRDLGHELGCLLSRQLDSRAGEICVEFAEREWAGVQRSQKCSSDTNGFICGTHLKSCFWSRFASVWLTILC